MTTEISLNADSFCSFLKTMKIPKFGALKKVKIVEMLYQHAVLMREVWVPFSVQVFALVDRKRSMIRRSRNQWRTQNF